MVSIVLFVRVSADTSTMFTTRSVTFTIVSLDYAWIALNIFDYKRKIIYQVSVEYPKVLEIHHSHARYPSHTDAHHGDNIDHRPMTPQFNSTTILNPVLPPSLQLTQRFHRPSQLLHSMRLDKLLKGLRHDLRILLVVQSISNVTAAVQDVELIKPSQDVGLLPQFRKEKYDKLTKEAMHIHSQDPVRKSSACARTAR